jgi:hypothetical protein
VKIIFDLVSKWERPDSRSGHFVICAHWVLISVGRRISLLPWITEKSLPHGIEPRFFDCSAHSLVALLADIPSQYHLSLGYSFLVSSPVAPLPPHSSTHSKPTLELSVFEKLTVIQLPKAFLRFVKSTAELLC